MISDTFLDFQLRPQSPEALHSTQFSHLMKHSSWLSWQHPHTPHMNYASFFWLEVFTWGLLGVCKFFYWNIPLEGHWIGIYQAFFEIIVYESSKHTTPSWSPFTASRYLSHLFRCFYYSFKRNYSKDLIQSPRVFTVVSPVLSPLRTR